MTCLLRAELSKSVGSPLSLLLAVHPGYNGCLTHVQPSRAVFATTTLKVVGAMRTVVAVLALLGCASAITTNVCNLDYFACPRDPGAFSRAGRAVATTAGFAAARGLQGGGQRPGRATRAPSFHWAALCAVPPAAQRSATRVIRTPVAGAHLGGGVPVWRRDRARHATSFTRSRRGHAAHAPPVGSWLARRRLARPRCPPD